MEPAHMTMADCVSGVRYAANCPKATNIEITKKSTRAYVKNGPGRGRKYIIQ